ncbi:MAG: OPT/YSL family transporter [Candidatus Heimdallarchaeota archaeon]|nr:OPT/YSL family transporter [Candidatus Heimdallarchaeota archaeon]MCK5048424.1 OPT/YSL family transporter [Candidatus Heimdallarchaeota archaeon]
MEEQKNALETVKTEENENDVLNSNASMRYILMWSVFLGLILNWFATFLRISMGFIGVGIGPMTALLIVRYFLKKKKAETRENLTLVAISYGATRAAEASIGLLFLIWFATNAEAYNITFVPPSWLLPSQEVLASKTLFTSEWIVPIIVHYFLMIIPGMVGIAFGYYAKDKFIHDDEAFPFPSVIQTNSTVGVLTDEAEEKGPLFWKFVLVGFVFALLTESIIALDFSSVSDGYIIGLMLGPIGISLFAAGMLIGNPKISVSVSASSVLAYSILSISIIGAQNDIGYFEFFTLGIQDHYFAPSIGLLLGGMLVGPIIWVIFKPMFSKKNSVTEEEGQNSTESGELGEVGESDTSDQKPQKQKAGNGKRLISLLRQNVKLIGLLLFVDVTSVIFVIRLNILEGVAIWVILITIFWIIVIGGVVNGYLATVGAAKTSTSVVPPFVFDSIPIYATGVNTPLPYLAIPASESDGTLGVVTSQKLALLNGIKPKVAMTAYLSGYIASTLTTPLFALLLWYTFGIGTERLPAPAFPVQGAIIAAFSSRSISSFLSIEVLLIFIAIGIILAFFGSELAIGLAIGIFFPPHMALALTLGGLVRIIYDKKAGKEVGKDRSSTIAPALAVGGSFVIPILILRVLLF